MYRHSVIAVILLISLSANAQFICDNNSTDIMRTYFSANKIKSNDTFYYSHNIFSISLAGDFNDTIRMFIGDSLVLNEIFLPNNSLLESKRLIQVSFKDWSERPLLKIFLVKQNKCMTEALNFKFPILEVRLKEKWYLTYTNSFSALE